MMELVSSMGSFHATIVVVATPIKMMINYLDFLFFFSEYRILIVIDLFQ